MLKSLSRGCVWAVLVSAGFFAAETVAQAQQLRGQGMGGMPLLLPRQPYTPGLLNNGSLQTTQNPNANLPNQVRFTYIAAMPLGDRLGNNGVFYDTNILPNVGLFQGGQFVGQLGQNGNNNNNNNNNPFNPVNPFQAARIARQQMMMALYGMQVQQGMMMQGPAAGFGLSNNPAYGWNDPSTMFGWYDPNSFGNPMGFAAPLNNQGFGAGFANGGGGF